MNSIYTDIYDNYNSIFDLDTNTKISTENLKSKISENQKKIKTLNIETIPTAYILLNGGNITSVSDISNTTPLSMEDKDNILSHALAGQFMGNKLIYFDCGSGSSNSMTLDLLEYVSNCIWRLL